MTSGRVVRKWVGEGQRVLLLTFDRPERANAYTAAMLGELAALLAEARACGSVRAAVVSGAGEAFCGGADLRELEARTESESLSLMSREVFDSWAAAPWPTLAAVNGPAVGGGFELALACDIRICAPTAFFSFPEIELGLVPAAGGIRRLVAEVSAARAKEVLLFEKRLDAATALAWGLVCHVAEQPLQLALRLAESLANRDPMCVAAAKLLIADQVEAKMGRGGEAIVQALLYGRRQRARA